ncbi:DNA-binding transcriptional regulator, GntR family [Microbacterium sp. cf046]|uniref:GntR family transcriptional regulator n=1 Tax=Microbacterium sp. cf046 TaxID=1761803 RepID=UPI0008F3F3C8|nr:GntR family transcriptional regulator [Microbacterium sp. cf046]SFS12630.1 DNA-binding transcriptional regulator, GntR family [Microbacterium sp. cf046]
MSTIVQDADTAAEESEQKVTDLIRGAIVRGEYAPNQRLIEADLSDTFAASRATVRTALLELANEGLVERLPNKGSRVRAISLDEAIEILEVRIGVEGLCAAKTAASVTDEDIAEFMDLRQGMIDAVAEGDLVEYSRLNQLLDQRVRTLSHHTTAAEVLARLHAQSVRHQFKLSSRPQRAKVSVLEHVAIIDAIAARDPDAAELAVREHLLRVIDALRDLP